MSALIAVVVFVVFWFGIARQLKKNGRGWLGRNIIAGVGASLAFLLVVMVDISLSDPAGQLAAKQAEREVEAPKAEAEPSALPHLGSVKALIDDFGDFSTEGNEFEVVSEQPLHIRLSPVITNSDPQDVIDEQTKRALIYGVYRSFIHTDIDSITVTAQPLEVAQLFKRSAGDGKLLDKPKFTVTKTRAQALQDVKLFLPVDKMADLVKPGDDFSSFTKEFNQLYYNDQGGAGLDAFILKITNR